MLGFFFYARAHAGRIKDRHAAVGVSQLLRRKDDRGLDFPEPRGSFRLSASSGGAMSAPAAPHLGPVLLAVAVACAGACAFGYHLGVVNGPLEMIAADLGIAGDAALGGFVGVIWRNPACRQNNQAAPSCGPCVLTPLSGNHMGNHRRCRCSTINRSSQWHGHACWHMLARRSPSSNPPATPAAPLPPLPTILQSCTHCHQ